MTVRELSELLINFDPNRKVVIETNVLGGYDDVTSVFPTTVVISAKQDIDVEVVAIGFN